MQIKSVMILILSHEYHQYDKKQLLVGGILMVLWVMCLTATLY